MKLKNNSRIAVIGGGPAGSFFCYFIIEIAKRLNINLNIDLYDPKRFNQKGPSGCNHCGGIISESLVQVLASEGINIPSEIIQVGIDSYIMHMDIGSAKIDTPVNEKRIASIFRASGPSCSKGLELKSFDQYLQDLIVTLGVNVIHEKVISVAYNDEFPVVNSNNNSSISL